MPIDGLKVYRITLSNEIEYWVLADSVPYVLAMLAQIEEEYQEGAYEGITGIEIGRPTDGELRETSFEDPNELEEMTMYDAVKRMVGPGMIACSEWVV